MRSEARDNVAMIRAAAGAGFVEEGRLRRSAWGYGEFLDEMIFGLLAEEWQAAGGIERWTSASTS